jgi:hypothetical protein
VEPLESRPQVATASLGPRSAQRSAISNGKRLLPGVDNRNPWVRRAKDVIADLTNDRAGDTSAAVMNLIRRAAVMSTELEQLEVKFATAGHAQANDLDLYTRTSGNLRRILESIGLQRGARDISPPSVDAYIDHIKQREAVE